ncbi:hypothetical protein HW555_008805 [Spodoptera exigua]|uniref:Pheromone binding protein 3 n=1 Tax=Spodoptera exigua TaxID=7107 RepID=A0A835GBX9_SPOEX|nr:hypothetical protein HW555_008805 [Spodoptera exigua]
MLIGLLMYEAGSVLGKNEDSVLRVISSSIGDTVLECQSEMDFKDEVIHNFMNFWNRTNSLGTKDLGCALVCVFEKNAFLSPDGNTVLSNNVRQFLRASGADELMSLRTLDLFEMCKDEVKQVINRCDNALELGKCFRYGIFQLHWNPEPHYWTRKEEPSKIPKQVTELQKAPRPLSRKPVPAWRRRTDLRRIVGYRHAYINWVNLVEMGSHNVFVALVLLAVVGMRVAEPSKDAMKYITSGFVKVLEECKQELNMNDHIIADLFHFWKLEYALLSRDTGCVIICMSKKLDLLDVNGRMHHGNAQEFAKRHGAGDDVASKIVQIIHDCEKKHERDDDECLRVLEVAKCFRTGIHDLDWQPKVEVIVSEVLTEI